MAKPAKPSKEYSSSTQEVWGPQADALKGLYGSAQDWYGQNSQGVQDAAGTAGAYLGAARDAVAQPWMQNLQGGNLAGYDIAGALSNSMGQNRDINSGNVIGSNAQAQQFGGQNTQAQQFGAGQGTQAQQFGAGQDIRSMGMGQGQDINTSARGQLDRPTWESRVYQDRIGPDGSLENMKGMFRQDADNARSDMLGSMDARAAASGMSGGSAHGNAIGRGQQGINQNLQANMARTGYDAYNRDIDRNLSLAQRADQFNEQRGAQDQQNSFNTQASNQQNQFRYGQQDQASDL